MGLQNGGNEEDTVMTHEKHTVLFASTYDNDLEKADGVTLAKEYILNQNYSQETVRIADRANIIVVVVR